MLGKVKNILHFFKAIFSVAYFGYPARKITVIGVTGTDGKTTTATLIYHILSKAGFRVALVSSVGAFIGGKKVDTGLHVTTPDSWTMQKLICSTVEKRLKYLVLEVTSHGIDQHRILGANIGYAVLTNITHEHLDYHKTFSRYLNTKVKMLKKADVVVLNRSDSSYNKIRKQLKGVKLISYDAETLTGKLKSTVDTKIPEKYNRLNATAAVLLTCQLGVNNDAIEKGVRTFPGVPGRMEKIPNKRSIEIYMDFAHTPNALENVLTALKKKRGRLITVLGCAGERDYLKRPLMGEISARLADVSIFTAEDPRYENVDNIIESIVKGTRKTRIVEISPEESDVKSHVFTRIRERGDAIAKAIKIANKKDIIVICGKGHEKSMAYNGIEYPWSDHKAVQFALKGKVLKIKRRNEN